MVGGLYLKITDSRVNRWNKTIIEGHFLDKFIQSSLLPSSSVFLLFNFCCSHAQVFTKILVHEFHISYYCIIIIIIIEKGWQCEAGKERLTPYQSEKTALALLLNPSSPTPSYTGSQLSFPRDTERITKVLRYREDGHKCSDVRPKHRM